MSNNRETKDSNSTGDDEMAKIEKDREKLRQITQETRFEIIKAILMHPSQMPSLDEVNYMNPERSKATLREHLDRLIDAGIVNRVELPEDQVTRDNPKVFFELSEEGRELLERFDLLSLKDTLREIYQNIDDKPDWIKRYEDAPRPPSEQHTGGTRAAA